MKPVRLLCLAACGLFSLSTQAELFAPLSQADLGLGEYRSHTGSPSANYWQQQVDYKIHAALAVEAKHRRVHIDGRARVRYQNRSPHPLTSLLFLLDLNRLQPGAPSLKPLPQSAELGFHGLKVSHQDTPLGIAIDHTLMTVHLEQPLASGDSIELAMQWRAVLPDKVSHGTRAGVEWLADNSPIVIGAQWFPRAAAYTDAGGWSHKPFLGQGEFSTEFGEYQVTLDVPANFTVAASGRPVGKPLKPISPLRARKSRRAGVAKARRIWTFESPQPMRDFTFATSPAFQVLTKKDAHDRQLQALFPEEAAPLWQHFALPAADYTLQVFDDALAPLPYSHISLVNVAGHGMEYPGLATISTRPDRTQHSDKTPAWNALTKYDFIGTVIHELGHNYVPMVVNTLEREWAWLDEGLVSFIEYRAEHGWEGNFDVIYGEPRSAAAYMTGPDHQPVMTEADQLKQKIANAYNKTAVNLNLLRYLVIGPETFDAALQDFYRQWQFKRPLPGDFFRAMESAAGQDLSWFWRSFFFTATNLDVEITGLQCDGKAMKLAPRKIPDAPALANNPALAPLTPYHTNVHPALADSYTNNTRSAPHWIESTAPTTSRCELQITKRGDAVAPVPVVIGLSDHRVRQFTLPVHAWQQATGQVNGSASLQWSFSLGANESPRWLQLDPHSLLPDSQPANNAVEVIP